MSQDIAYLNPNDDLKSLLAVLYNYNVSHVPVVSDNKLVGLVSKTDVTNFLFHSFEGKSFLSFQELFTETKVKELMTQPIIDAQENEPTISVLEKLINHEIGCVVIKDGEKLSGIVTERDMVRYLTKTHEDNLSFAEKLSSHLVQWLDKHGIIRLSSMLGDIGI